MSSLPGRWLKVTERRLRLNAFSMNCVSHIQHGLWRRADTRQLEFNRLEPWLELAQLLEKGGFDALFLADVIGVYDCYRGNAETAIREAAQIPSNDPALLIPAMAKRHRASGSRLHQLHSPGSPVHVCPPGLDLGSPDWRENRLERGHLVFAKCRREPRVWWLAATRGALPAGRGVSRRYLQSVGGKLGGRRFAPRTPSGEFMPTRPKSTPSTMPVNFTRSQGPICASRHRSGLRSCFRPTPRVEAETLPPSMRSARSSLHRGTLSRARRASSKMSGNVRFTRAASPRTSFFSRVSLRWWGDGSGSECQRSRIHPAVESRGLSGAHKRHLGCRSWWHRPDAPVGSLETDATHSVVQGLIDAAPDKTWTFRDVARVFMTGQFLSGTPEQIADALEEWFDADIDGFNIVYAATPGTSEDFIDAVVPELRRRALASFEYSPGTLREKLFGRARLPDRHPGAAHRRLITPRPVPIGDERLQRR